MTTTLVWKITKKRGVEGYNAIQASEFNLYDENGNKIAFPQGTFVSCSLSSGTESESSNKLIDSNSGTKWCSPKWGSSADGLAVVTFTIPADIKPYAYSYTTANDDYNRDPVTWELYFSVDGSDRYLVSNVTSATITDDRRTETQRWMFDYSNVQEKPDLDKITKVQYVESDGTQVINLDYVHTSNTKIELDCRVTKNNQRNYEVLFGSRYNSHENNAFVFFSRFYVKDIPVYNRTGAETQGSDFLYDEDIVLTCYLSDATWVNRDGLAYSISTDGTCNEGIAPLLLFDVNNATVVNGINPEGSRSVMRVYSLKIYENDILVRHYEPCLDSNKVPILYENIDKKFYYSLAGNELIAGAVIDEPIEPDEPEVTTKYLLRSEGTLCTVIDDELVILEETELTADVFHSHGLDEIPSFELLMELTNPEILYWQSEEVEDELPVLKATLTATPIPQTVIVPIDLSHPTILGVQKVTATCTGNPLFAFSFDNGVTWKIHDGTDWTNMVGDAGMTKLVLEAITTEQWNQVVTGLSSFKMRFVLNDLNDTVTNITIDYINEGE